MSTLLKFSGILLMSAFAFAGVYALKITLNKLIPAGSSAKTILWTMPQIIYEIRFWQAGFCYVMAMVVYLFLLQGDEVSKIFPIAVGVNILLTAIGAMIFLGDNITPVRALGILFIVFGIALINHHGT